MESQIKVTFWINKSKKNQKNLVPIYIRVTFNYDYFTRSTSLSVKESDWDKKSMKVKGISSEACLINTKLDSLKMRVHQIINQFTVLGKPFNIHNVKDTLEGKNSNQVTIVQVIDEHLKMMKKLLGKEYEQPTIIKYANTKLRILQFLKHKYKRSDMYLYELNDDFLREFEHFLKDKYENSTTTCYKHYQRFTHVVRIAIQKGYLDKFPFRDYKIRMQKKRIEYLDREELAKIEKLEITIERLDRVRDVFVFCCYSGLAYNEVFNLKHENIFIGMDGEKWLNIHRKKTNKDYQVPLLPKAIEIIYKYSNHPFCMRRKGLLPVTSNVKMNAYLKEIGDLAKIQKYLTTHLARKTFATTVMLANGVNIGVLSRLLGHSSIQVTLDSYAAVMDELMLNNVSMIRAKFSNSQ
jgi:integrase/recombinase XerD